MSDLFAEMHDLKQRATVATSSDSPEIMEEDLRFDDKFIRSSKSIYELMQGKPFSGTDDEAHRYGINIMGDFIYNFANPVSAEVSGFEIRPGTMAQLARIMASGSRNLAKDWTYLFDQYEKLPDFTASGAWRMARGLLMDPSTWTGAGLLATGAKKVGAKGIATTIKHFATTLKEHPIKSGAAAGAVYAGVPAAGEQVVEEQAGIEKPLIERAADVALQTGIGAVAGGALAKAADVLPGLASKAVDTLDQKMTLTDKEREAIDMIDTGISAEMP